MTDDGLPVVGIDVPDVRECFGHKGASCEQCNGSHAHVWVQCARVGKYPGDRRYPVRCRVCGARKCDVPDCIERRHHRSPHMSATGILYPVGG